MAYQENEVRRAAKARAKARRKARQAAEKRKNIADQTDDFTDLQARRFQINRDTEERLRLAERTMTSED